MECWEVLKRTASEMKRAEKSAMLMDREVGQSYMPTSPVAGKCFVNGFELLGKKGLLCEMEIGEKQRRVSEVETRFLVSKNQD